jgi:L-ascorbate metabolism protein UlaG (beta-lactamase superfamily)
MSELDEFTAQLNAGADNKPAGQPPANISPEQLKAMQEQQAATKALLEKELEQTPLKGKVDLKWYGHSGVKISWKDTKDVQRNVYINICSDNPNCPAEDKKNPPNDADLALVTQGQFEHSMHAPFLMQAGKKENRQIVCTSEVGLFFQMFKNIPAPVFAKMQPGGTKDFEYCKITMVHSEKISSCPGPNGVQIPGGNACGFVVTIPNVEGATIYHCGDTSIFSDMKLINDLYEPNIVLLPIGDQFSMNIREGAHALKNFLTNAKISVRISLSGF